MVPQIFGSAFAKSDGSGVKLLSGRRSQEKPIFLECILENCTEGEIIATEDKLEEFDGGGVGGILGSRSYGSRASNAAWIPSVLGILV